jgi:hypothetical protein
VLQIAGIAAHAVAGDEVTSPIGSSSAMIATSVVSLNSEMKLLTRFGIEIFSACGMMTSRIAFQ